MADPRSPQRRTQKPSPVSPGPTHAVAPRSQSSPSTSTPRPRSSAPPRTPTPDSADSFIQVDPMPPRSASTSYPPLRIPEPPKKNRGVFHSLLHPFRTPKAPTPTSLALEERHRTTELSRTKERVSYLEQQLLEARQDASGARRACGTLEGHLVVVERLKSDAETSLAEARSFLALDDAGDMQRLVLGMKDLNDSVEDLAFELFAELSGEMLSARVEGTTIEFLRAAGAIGASRIAEQATKKGGTVQESLLLILQSLIIEHLHETIFAPFHPSLSLPDSALLSSVHQSLSLQASLPQSHLSHWRALTYSSLPRPIPSSSLTNLLQNLVATFPHFLPLESLAPVERILRAGFEWQELSRTGYLSCEVRAWIPGAGERFEEGRMRREGEERRGSEEVAESGGGEMERGGGEEVGKGERGGDDGKGEGRTVLGALGFGVERWRVGQEREVLLRAEVVRG